MESTGFLFPIEIPIGKMPQLAAKWRGVASSHREWAGIIGALARRERALRKGRERPIISVGSAFALGQVLGYEIQFSGALDFYVKLWGDNAPLASWSAFRRPIGQAGREAWPESIEAFPRYVDEVRIAAEGDIQCGFLAYLSSQTVLKTSEHNKPGEGPQLSGREFVEGVCAVQGGGVVWHLRDAAILHILRRARGFADVYGTDFILEAACCGLGILAETQEYVFATAMPSIVHNETDRLHNPKGPALTWEDGRSAYFLHGVEVDPHIVLNPDSLNLKRILSEGNAERRRVYTLQFGMERFLGEAGAHLIARNPRGKLWRCTQRGFRGLMAVEVKCPSTGRRYFLRVPSGIRRSVDVAIAWTFDMLAQDYRPEIET